ncbi:phage tail protein [Mycobacterium sp. G7A2]|uniref:phage tail protein n=1 Tax=Mycobacterium sp. G7A2 TaxID=3317307 RepID=UPI0035A8DA0D
MTIPIEPIYIGGHSVYVKFWAIARNPGDPSRIEGTLTLVGSEGNLTLDALVGPQGVPGTPSPVIRPEWGSPVTDPADLPLVATLDDSDNGRAWFFEDTGKWYVYHEGNYHIVEGSIPGPKGDTPDVSISAEVIEAEGSVYGEIEVIESGTTAAPNFHFKIPGVPGPEGPASSIGEASDFDDTDAQLGKLVGVVDNDPITYGLIEPSILYPKTYTIPQSSFIDYNGSAGRQLIASINIPAQSFEWYPDVAGHVRIRRSGLISTAQLEIEVRIGNTGVGAGESEPLCGLAPYDPTTLLFDSVTIAHILPHFSDEGDPLRSISPDSSVARVPDGQAKTLYVFVHKIGGVGNYEFTNPGAQLRVNLLPVV